jgi:opacity protein-like surface antigen
MLIAERYIVKRTLAMACALAFSASVAIAADPVKVAPPQQKTLTGNGRYVFGQISDYRSDQYMLDTQTGKLWRVVLRRLKTPDGTEVPGDGVPALDAVPYVGADGSLSAVPK